MISKSNAFVERLNNWKTTELLKGGGQGERDNYGTIIKLQGTCMLKQFKLCTAS